MHEPIDFLSRKADIEARRNAEIPPLTVVGSAETKAIAYRNASYLASKQLQEHQSQNVDPYKPIFMEHLFQGIRKKLELKLPLSRTELTNIVTKAISDIYVTALDDRLMNNRISEETYWRSREWLEDFLSERASESLGPER